MKLSDSIYRRLVLLNTLFLCAVLVVGTAIAWKGRDQIVRRLRSFVESEVASSRFVQTARALATDENAPDVAVPLYELRINPANLRKIQTQVASLVGQGIQTDADKVWYPARFWHDGIEYKVKIRLRGDLPNHWENAKKSWRIRFDKDRLFKGIKELDLTIPVDRAYQTEQVACDIAESLGVLAAPGGFCQVRLNGIDMGLYLWSEKYGAQMLEKMGYPPGEIFREANTWTQRYFSGFGLCQQGDPSEVYTYYAANYRQTINKGPGMGRYARRWDRFCRLIRQADDATFARQVDHLLDVEKYLRFNAVTWLFGSTHCRWGDNLRWYYDDTRGLFEPILYDVYRQLIETPVKGSFEADDPDALTRRILSISEYRHRRNEILWGLLNDPASDAAGRSERYFRVIRPYLLRGVDAMSGPDMNESFHNTRDILADNRRVLKANLEYARLFATPTITARQGALHLSLELLPDSLCPLSVDELTLTFSANVAAQWGVEGCDVRLQQGSEPKFTKPVAKVQQTDPQTLRLTLNGADLHAPVDAQLRPIAGPWTLHVNLHGLVTGDERAVPMLTQVEIKCRNTVTGQSLGDEFVFVFPVIDDPQPGLADLADSSPEAFVQASGLPFVHGAGRMILPAGDYTVERNLVLPYGYDLVLEPGVTLRLGPAVSVLVYGSITALGTAQAPIKLVPARSSEPWGSFAAVRASNRSILRHVTVRGGSEAHLNGLYLSGQLCFYSSDVRVTDCRILDARADDGLNVKRAEVSISDSLLAGNRADAFDGDWVNGSITRCIFEDNGGDGVDLSGSQLTVRDCLLTRMGDKAISAGEKSRVIVVNNLIRNSKIAVAAKDLSEVDLYACVLRENDTALAVYRKKQLFGGARVRVLGTVFWGNGQVVELDEESHLEARSIATDAWTAGPGIAARDVRKGNLEQYYVEDDHGYVQHRPERVADSPFAPGPRLTDQEQGRFGLSGFADHPIGLVRPLRLPQSLRGAF